jgi:prolyl 4-hydroxylase
MLCVATDVEEPWPFEMYDHVTQQAHNVTLEPGEMLLFESHSVIHGHPFPLKGNYQAMIFLHFEPTGHPLVYDDKRSGFKRIDQEYRQSVKEGVGGQSSASNGSLPPYIQRSSPEEAHWRQMHPQGWNPPYEELPSNAHIAAMKGNLEDLVEELLKDPDETKKILEAKDENGWQLLHHGIVSGSQEIVEFLVKQGAEINARTHSGYGETPLRMAEERYGDKHPIVTFLTKMGALSLGPEL